MWRPSMWFSHPYNLFERAIEVDILPYCRKNGIATLGLRRVVAGGCCQGACAQIQSLTATICAAPTGSSSPAAFAQYIWRPVAVSTSLRTRATEKPSSTSRRRWNLDAGITCALWGARRPDQLAPVNEVSGWSVDDEGKAVIEKILRERSSIPSVPSSWRHPNGRNARRKQRCYEFGGTCIASAGKCQPPNVSQSFICSSVSRRRGR